MDHPSDDQPDNPADHHGSQPDDPPDDQPDAKWMTFAELAKARGISKLSAAALVRRHRWRRMKDNRGRVLALVPRDGPELRRSEAHQADDPADDQADHLPDVAATIASLTSAFDAAVATLTAQLAGAVQRAEAGEQGRELERAKSDAAVALVDQTMAALADSNARTDRAEAETRELRDRIDVLQARLAQAQAAVQGADELRAAEDARRAMSRWARAWGAWRGR
jgi:hypothetical protein